MERVLIITSDDNFKLNNMAIKEKDSEISLFIRENSDHINRSVSHNKLSSTVSVFETYQEFDCTARSPALHENLTHDKQLPICGHFQPTSDPDKTNTLNTTSLSDDVWDEIFPTCPKTSKVLRSGLHRSPRNHNKAFDTVHCTSSKDDLQYSGGIENSSKINYNVDVEDVLNLSEHDYPVEPVVIDKSTSEIPDKNLKANGTTTNALVRVDLFRDTAILTTKMDYFRSPWAKISVVLLLLAIAIVGLLCVAFFTKSKTGKNGNT